MNSQFIPNLSHRNPRALDSLGLVEVTEVFSIVCEVWRTSCGGFDDDHNVLLSMAAFFDGM